jgi:hypothetical protein
VRWSSTDASDKVEKDLAKMLLSSMTIHYPVVSGRTEQWLSGAGRLPAFIVTSSSAACACAVASDIRQLPGRLDRARKQNQATRDRTARGVWPVQRRQAWVKALTSW